MGMYTEFVFASELKKETPIAIIKVLESMISGNFIENKDYVINNHNFFKCDRWKWLFLSDSYYFDGESMSNIEYDKISNTYFLTVRSNLKNYNEEILNFIDFIYPYLVPKSEEDDFLGYYRYEKRREPTLIYYSEIEELLKILKEIE